jgi:signal transduction histidine kinase
LVQNAQEATDDIGSVRLELSGDEQHAVIKVIDNGSGMDEKFIAERLFKPFDTTKGNAGMGIGVYEARDYVLKYSGEITVLSKPGEGTTFTIRLPRVKQEAKIESLIEPVSVE